MPALIWKLALCHSWCTVPCCHFNKRDFIGGVLPCPSPLPIMKFHVQIQIFMQVSWSWLSVEQYSCIIYLSSEFSFWFDVHSLCDGLVGIPQLEQLPSSAANFKISNSHCLLWWMLVHSILASFTALLRHPLISTFCHLPCTKLSGFS
jgi:hypothetical protein